jgi:citronellol/citronellal dehydrogenase
MEPRWFAPHVGYSIAKFGMSLCTLGWAAEFAPLGIAANALWPRTAIATAAVANLLGGKDAVRCSRTPEIMGDAALAIFTSDAATCTGKFFIDDEVMAAVGVTDLAKYKVDPAVPDADLILDFFV